MTISPARGISLASDNGYTVLGPVTVDSALASTLHLPQAACVEDRKKRIA